MIDIAWHGCHLLSAARGGWDSPAGYEVRRGFTLREHRFLLARQSEMALSYIIPEA